MSTTVALLFDGSQRITSNGFSHLLGAIRKAEYKVRKKEGALSLEAMSPLTSSHFSILNYFHDRFTSVIQSWMLIGTAGLANV